MTQSGRFLLVSSPDGDPAPVVTVTWVDDFDPVTVTAVLDTPVMVRLAAPVGPTYLSLQADAAGAAVCERP